MIKSGIELHTVGLVFKFYTTMSFAYHKWWRSLWNPFSSYSLYLPQGLTDYWDIDEKWAPVSMNQCIRFPCIIIHVNLLMTILVSLKRFYCGLLVMHPALLYFFKAITIAKHFSGYLSISIAFLKMLYCPCLFRHFCNITEAASVTPSSTTLRLQLITNDKLTNIVLLTASSGKPEKFPLGWADGTDGTPRKIIKLLQTWMFYW